MSTVVAPNSKSSSVMNDLQQLGFALQSNYFMSETASSYCSKCDPEIRRLRAQLQESLLNQDALEAELRYALEGRLAAEVALAEHLTHARSIIDHLAAAAATPRGPFEWMNASTGNSLDNESHLSLFSQPLITSPRYTGGSSIAWKTTQDHRHEDGKLCDEVTKELELQLAKLSSQFQTLAECYSGTANRLQQTQNEMYELKSENLELQASNVELTKSYRLTERRLQKILMEFDYSLPSLSYGIAATGPGEPTLGHLTSPELTSSASLTNAADRGTSPLPCLESVFGGSHVDVPPTSISYEESMSKLSISTGSISENPTMSPVPPSSAGHHGRVLSERTNISNLVIPKPDLKSWYAPNKLTSRDHEQVDSPGTGTPTNIKGSSNTSSTLETPSKLPLCDTLVQATDCTVLVENPSHIFQHSAAIEGSGSKVTTGLTGSATLLPKSISIRASSVSLSSVRTNRSCPTSKRRSVSPESTESIHSLVLSPVSPLRPHRLRLSPTMDREELISSDSGGKEGTDQELDVYDQGMYKTELCNKWQEGGNCPYGNRCQFAHGVEELRPVLRHPRYKTELCRMVANGERCPYGHRCHFRHSMTQEEKASLL